MQFKEKTEKIMKNLISDQILARLAQIWDIKAFFKDFTSNRC